MHLSLFFPPEALVGGDPVEDTLGISEKIPTLLAFDRPQKKRDGNLDTRDQLFKASLA